MRHFQRQEYERTQDTELARLRLLVERDSYKAAAEWALRTLRGYRQCILSDGQHGRPFHFASLSPYRERFLASYVVMKVFVEVARQRGALQAAAAGSRHDGGQPLRPSLKLKPEVAGRLLLHSL